MMACPGVTLIVRLPPLHRRAPRRAGVAAILAVARSFRHCAASSFTAPTPARHGRQFPEARLWGSRHDDGRAGSWAVAPAATPFIAIACRAPSARDAERLHDVTIRPRSPLARRASADADAYFDYMTQCRCRRHEKARASVGARHRRPPFSASTRIT